MEKLFRKDGYTIVEILIVVAILGIVVVPFFRVIMDATYIGNASTKEVDLNHAAQDLFERIKSDNRGLTTEVKNLADGVPYVEEVAYDTGYDNVTVNIRYTNNSDEIGITSTGSINVGDGDPGSTGKQLSVEIPLLEDTGLLIKEGAIDLFHVDQSVTDNTYTIKLDETTDNPVEYMASLIYNGTTMVNKPLGVITDSVVVFKVMVKDNNENKVTLQFLNMTGGSTGKFVKVYEYNDIDAKVELSVTNQDTTSQASTSSVYIYSGLSETSESATKIKWYDVEVIFEENSKQVNAIDGEIIERYVTTIHKDVSN